MANEDKSEWQHEDGRGSAKETTRISANLVQVIQSVWTAGGQLQRAPRQVEMKNVYMTEIVKTHE